jgi:hypothetical protein
MRRESGRVDRRGMTTSTAKGARRWSNFLRSLAPGPVALGIQSCLDPAVWHATWQAMGSDPADQPGAEDDVVDERTRP